MPVPDASRLLPPTLLAVLALAAAVPQTAAGDATVTRDGGTITVDTGSGTSDGIILGSTATTVTIQIWRGPTSIVATSPCTLSVVTASCPAAALDRLVVRTNDRLDVVELDTAVPGVVQADLGAGADQLTAAVQGEPVIVQGGDGADIIQTGPGNDVAAGDGGPDAIDTGLGRDEIDGGAGTDQMSYAARTAPLRISLDGVANDGDPAEEERDNVLPGVERVFGGAAGDALTGGDHAEELHGLGGDDRLDGRGAVDRLFGGSGGDVLLARDGLAERVSCDAEADSATVDEFDTVNACEALDVSAALQPDRDGDGVLAPQDCDDLAAAIRPGVFDTPENGADENCDGADGVDLDRDRDGWPRPLDCDDGNPVRRPGAPEAFGNATDEDCDGTPEPFPAFEGQVRLGSLVYRRPSYTKVTGLRITALSADDRLVVRCRGKGCPFKRKRPRPPAAGGDLEYERRFERARLRPGARLKVTVVRTDGVGATTTYAIRNAKPPKRTRRCFIPAAPKEAPC